ncbi:unnamed protein product [Blepharisma stoltei]|uniref:Uncharacterized protein n=1 Tax=Blepharisma stoltei TaxID=1481888 RepID=A0AAU9JC68_9CILI|nr:unnamed protein product [Blepharisma stoltei]
MAEEIITLQGIVQPSKMEANVNSDLIEYIIGEGISLACYLPHLRLFLKPVIKEKKWIDIQEIFNVLDDVEFWRNVRELANGFETEINVKLIKAAIFLFSKNKITVPWIKTYYSSYVSLDFESRRNGVKQDPSLLQKSFILVNRFLPLKLISLWLEHNTPNFKHIGRLTPHEYLFLAANTYDRSKLIEERLFSQPGLIIAKDSNTNTFILSETVSSNPDLDKRLEKIMSSQINASNVLFEPQETISDSRSPYKLKKFLRKNKNQVQSKQMNELRVLLQDPNLYEQVKQTLSKSSSIVNKSRTNENFSYQRMRATCGILNSARPYTATNPLKSRSEKDLKSKRMLSDCQLPLDELNRTGGQHHRYIVSFRETDKSNSSSNLIKDCSDSQIRPFSASSTATLKGANRVASSRPMTGSTRPFTANSLANTSVSLTPLIIFKIIERFFDNKVFYKVIYIKLKSSLKLICQS